MSELDSADIWKYFNDLTCAFNQMGKDITAMKKRLCDLTMRVHNLECHESNAE